MSDLPRFEAPIAAADFEKYAVEAVITSAGLKTCECYEELFSAQAQSFADEHNNEGFQVFRLLTAACSLVPQFGDIKHPFRPKVVDYVHRCSTPDVDYFTAEHCAAFKEFLPKINDAELRARLADLVIVKKFDHRIVTMAAEAYLKTALHLLSTDRWYPCIERFRRACWLSTRPGIDKAIQINILDEIKKLIADRHSEEAGLFTAHLISLVVMFDAPGSSNYAPTAEKLANRARGNKQWHVARSYFEVAHNIYRAVKPPDDEKAIAAAVEIAETFALEADNAEKATPPELGKACYCYEEARNAYAGIKGRQERRGELYKKLLICQENSISETTFANLADQIPTPDLSPLIDSSKQAVKGKTFPESVLTLVNLFRPLDFEETAKKIRTPDDGSSVWIDIISKSKVDPHGKTKAYKDSVLAESFDEESQFDYEYCHTHARPHWWLSTSGIIFPALQQIAGEHAIRLEDVEFITQNNSLVPLNRIKLISRGLHYGFTGDFAAALHLLLPQFENSLRFVLHQRGEVASTMDSEGIQDERNINTLLREHPALERIFGKDLMWDFWALLVAKWGGNIRNHTAHGMTADDDFFGPEPIYAWALLLKFYCLPLLVQQTPPPPSPDSKS
jgi:hypothetical protein